MSAVTVAFHVSKVASTVQDIFTSRHQKAYRREQESFYRLERAERLAVREAIFAIRDGKENSVQQDSWRELEASEEAESRIACLRESPPLARIPGKINSFLSGSDDSHSCLELNSSSESTHDKGPALIQIGPLPESWFIEPSALEIKFNHLTCRYCSDRDIHVIAYDKTTERRIYVEFPTHFDAASFINKWTAAQPDGFEDVSVQVLESLL